MTVDIDHTIIELAAANDNVVSRTELLAAGVNRSSISRRVGTTLTPITAGVYVVGALSPTRLLRAGLEAVDGSAIADEAAAVLHGLPIRDRDVLALIAPRGRTASLPSEIRLRQTRHLPEADVTLCSSQRVTTIERTICDLGRFLPVQKIQHLIEWAITERRMSRSSFQACARAYCRRGRTGSAMVRLLTYEILGDRPMPASELERLGLQLFTQRGLMPFTMHFTPPWSDGVTGIVDVAWPQHRLIVELDGRRWHTVSADQQRDRRRDRQANAHGWVVMRFGWQELTDRSDQVVEEIRWMRQQREQLPVLSRQRPPSAPFSGQNGEVDG